MGLAKRRLYKPERKPARKRGVLHEQAPIGCANANANEIALALFSLAAEAGVAIGRGGTYDSLRDEYTVVGKSRETGKVQDFKVQGAEVAALIKVARMMNGGKLERGALVT
jgi:hypothetical protein